MQFRVSKCDSSLKLIQLYRVPQLIYIATRVSRPPILIATDYETTRELLNVEHNSGGNSTRVSIGILVENYSKYRLQDARASSPCSANREVYKCVFHDKHIHSGASSQL